MPSLAEFHRAGLHETAPGVISAGKKPRRKARLPKIDRPAVLRLDGVGNCQALENKFLLLWKNLGGPELRREFRFSKIRRWRSDFAHLPSRTLIEIEGGIYSGLGRHNAAEGYTLDAKKYNAAVMSGFRILRFTSKMLNPDSILPAIEFLKSLPPANDDEP